MKKVHEGSRKLITIDGGSVSAQLNQYPTQTYFVQRTFLSSDHGPLRQSRSTAFLTLRKLLDAEVRYGCRSLICEGGWSIHLAVFVNQFEPVVMRVS